MNLFYFIFFRTILFPFVVTPLFLLLGLFNSKIREGMSLRFRHSNQDLKSKLRGRRPVWIHAASGEFEYAKSVLREIKKANPNQVTLVTYFSPTFVKSISNCPDVDAFCPLPWDLPGPVMSFLMATKPLALCIARTDLWPEVLRQCNRRGIPAMIFAKTYNGSQRSSMAKLFDRLLYKNLNAIHCVSEEDQKGLVHLGLDPSKIKILGDPRYDQVSFRLANSKVETPLPPPALATMIAGSTWVQDELRIVPALKSFIQEGKLNLAIVPHEPSEEHIQRLEQILKRHQLPYQKLSENKKWQTKSVFIVDAVGKLAEFYKLGKLAFVGGSFRKSVHSVMEPLGTGALTFVGPKHQNNREAIEFQQLKLGEDPLPLAGVTAVKSVDDLIYKLAIYTELGSKAQLFHLQISQKFDEQLGASVKIANEILKLSLPIEPKPKVHSLLDSNL